MQKVMFPTDDDIQRVLSMQGGDYGFFVLSLYSFIEAYIRILLGYTDSAYDTYTFRTLVRDFTDYLKQRGFIPQPEFSMLKKLPDAKNVTNLIRHQFKTISKEEAQAAVASFQQFAKLINADCAKKFDQLDEFLQSWNERTNPAETAEELKKANALILSLQKENSAILAKKQAFDTLTAELEETKAQLQLLDAQNALLEKKSAEKDEKYDAARKAQFESRAAFQKKEQELLEKLKDFDAVKAYIQNMQRLSLYTRTRNDYEKSLLRLTHEQAQAVSRMQENHDFLVRGSAGTGKSLVLLEGMKKLLSQPELFSDGKPQVVLLTFTKSLVKYNTYIAELMNMGLQEEHILTADNFLAPRIAQILPKKTISFATKDFVPYFVAFCEDKKQAESYLQEANEYIWQNMLTEQEYCVDMIERTGMQTQLRADERKKIWQVTQAATEKLLAESADIPRNLALYLTANALVRDGVPPQESADYIFVDEAQDLNVCQLAILKACAKKGVILAGDDGQSIFQPSFSWKRSGILVSGYSCTLQTDFRNTMQIAEAAETYRATITGIAPDERKTSSFRMGPPVELTTAKTTADLLSLIADSAHLCISEFSYAPENICIILTQSTKNQVKQMQSLLAKKYRLESVFMTDKDFSFEQEGKVRITTHQSCKGLDFPVVLLLEDHSAHIYDKKYSAEQVEKMKRSLIYVAMTRAMDMLHVFTLEEPTAPCIQDLQQILRDAHA